ncbi:MAG: FAD-binding oxidoreductase [Thermoleophilia bacterium]|nr:FAD-binding oxidoreductase [Thermoleophilia bacterium]
MATFITIGYGDRAGYERTDPAVRDAAHAHDARLRADGVLMGAAGTPVQVRNHDDAGVRTAQGPYMHADLPVAGFAVVEAATAEEAATLVADSPWAVAQGVVEVWPLRPTPAGIADEIAPLRADGMEIVLPGDDDWDAARRAWHLTYDQRPDAVALPRTADEVIRIVKLAGATGRRVAAQSTGHNAPPLGDLAGTILLRTANMRGAEILPETRTARVNAGAWWEDVIVPAAEHGLSALHGSSPDVGVVGYVLSGGIGWQVRKHGLAANSVTAFELVTPAGELIRADAEQHADVFWALRGGGGNYGVVTALELELYPLEEVYCGWLVFPWERSAEVLQAWREWTATVPEEVTSVGRILQLPPLEQIPEPLRGRNIVVVEAAILTDEATAVDLLAPLRALGPEMDTFATTGPIGLMRLHQDPEGPTPVFLKADNFDTLTAETIDTFVAHLGPGSGSPLVSAEIRHVGGAAGRPHPGGGALDRFQGEFVYVGIGMPVTPELTQAIPVHLELVHRAFEELANGRTYLNFAEEPADTGTAFTAGAHERLRTLRRRMDPENRMRANHPIPA